MDTPSPTPAPATPEAKNVPQSQANPGAVSGKRIKVDGSRSAGRRKAITVKASSLRVEQLPPAVRIPASRQQPEQ